jgi:hypothetical protein
MSIENLKTFDPFAEADEDTGQVKQSQQDYIHIRIQRTLRLTLQKLLILYALVCCASHANLTALSCPSPHLHTTRTPHPPCAD